MIIKTNRHVAIPILNALFVIEYKIITYIILRVETIGESGFKVFVRYFKEI